MAQTNHPVRFIGPVPYRRTPILSLAFIQAAALAEMEIDLSSLPPLISGGDRKARGKAIAEQRSSLSAPRRIDRRYLLRPDPAYGSMAAWCRRCNYMMLFDGVDDDDAVICDRCKRPI